MGRCLHYEIDLNGPEPVEQIEVDNVADRAGQGRCRGRHRPPPAARILAQYCLSQAGSRGPGERPVRRRESRLTGPPARQTPPVRSEATGVKIPRSKRDSSRSESWQLRLSHPVGRSTTSGSSPEACQWTLALTAKRSRSIPTIRVQHP